jgi:hypothetical protein
MSPNLDLVRSIFADWERGDYSRAEWAHTEIELVIADGPSPGTWTGRAGMVEGWSGFLTAWEGHRSHADSYRELGNDRILVLARGTGRAKRSRWSSQRASSSLLRCSMFGMEW